MTLMVGTTGRFHGNVTTLNWIGTKPPAAVEASLGYGSGRLSAGYNILVLKEALTALDFEFDGTTLRSGGRMGLPANTISEDERRKRVHDAMIKEYGEAGYRQLQHKALASAQLTGPNRIAKVLPRMPHDSDMAPSHQYPMGGGGLQWKLLRPGKIFVVALFVRADGIAELPGRNVDIRQTAPYENRRDVMQYLQMA
ncbi:MAG: hypothetical protein ACOVQ0_00160 [Novosphingobium sp.]|uniref:hypothetical protein n=1 Tax=Novosphingobium sp. TaxID=1874826 RepID=UPI003B9A22D1